MRYTRTALRQIDDALSYISGQSPQVAAALRKRIVSAAALVQAHPYAAQATSRANTRRIVLTPYPYVLFYRVAADEIVIMRVRHAARRPLPEGEQL